MINSKETYKIGGMSCAACGKAAERAVKKIDGVTNQSVNMATEKLEIEYDANKVNFEILSSAISKAGYNLAEDISYKNIVYILITF